MRSRFLLGCLICALSAYLGFGFALQCDAAEDFYIYADKNSPKNHFIPSGWMGDYNDMKFNDQETSEFAAGATSIEITYTAKKSQNQGWAGIYWQSSQNNWGGKDTGFDLSDYNKLVFSAKGAKGGEVLTKVKVGGITTNDATGEPVDFPDTLNVKNSPIRLTSEWQEYSINLLEKDVSNVNGGFAVVFNVDHAGGEQAVYLDEIRFTYDAGLTKEVTGANF